MNSRSLIISGAGFLGSHICKRFISEGHDVICLDNFFSGNKVNIAHWLDKANFELMRSGKVVAVSELAAISS